MSDENPFGRAFAGPDLPSEDEYVPVTVVEEAPPRAAARRAGSSPRRLLIHLALFVATCGSTFFGWLIFFGPRGALTYSLLIMTILVCHEMGHYLQARRYGVRATLPFFLPMPISPLGTLGAVIAMEPRIGDRRALFDIGITGPLAGLVPTLVCCVVGVQTLGDPAPVGDSLFHFGDPLLLELMYWWRFGPLPAGWDVPLNPFLWAGWVGLLVTSLNLMPIGQLDGGHVLYAMMRKRAHRVARFLLLGAVAAVSIGLLVFWYRPLQVWVLMLVLLVWMGPKHPPTAGDDVPLGSWRYVLGWLTLAFIVIGFTPRPFIHLAPPH
jgi:membrane-associated protease RseP (regulator of RpoE activity)